MNVRFQNLPPGTILQLMWLRRRLSWRLSRSPKSGAKFLDIGSGSGEISNIFLEQGLEGFGLDISEAACRENRIRNGAFVRSGAYDVVQGCFFKYDFKAERFDFIVSSHVIEHLTSDDVDRFFKKCKSITNPGGKILILVPAGTKYWGIEDETAGHYRRYESSDFEGIASSAGLDLGFVCGLTFPVSNILLPISNYLVAQAESWKKDLSKTEQTATSSSGGARNIPGKTHFPSYFKYLLNEISMYPLYLVQQLFKKSSRCLVLYGEFTGR